MLSWKRPLGSHRHDRNWLPLSDLTDGSFRIDGSFRERESLGLIDGDSSRSGSDW